MGFVSSGDTKKVRAEKLKKGHKIYKDGNIYEITSIFYDKINKRYLIDGEKGYFASIPKGKTLTIKK